MSRFRDYLLRSRRLLKQGRSHSRKCHTCLWSDGEQEAVACRTRTGDVLLIRHRYSMRVHWTVVLPPGLLDDLWGKNREEVIMSFLRKATSNANGKPSGVVPPNEWVHLFPALTEYLFSEAYPDGSSRQRATVTVMAGDCKGVKLVLNDRDEGRSLWATGDDLGAAMEALEFMLQAETTPWRMDRPIRGGPAKK